MSMAEGALPSSLPADLSHSIARVLSQRQAGPSKGSSDDDASTSALVAPSSLETPSLTAQLTQLFPTAESISPLQVERRQAEIRRELAEQERRIEELVADLFRRQQQQTQTPNGIGTDAGPSGSLSTATVEARVEVLLAQLATIREKARKSEEVVREITREIRNLDTCKRNVVASMTALKRLQMLVNAVAQLERLTKASRFREAASALSAVKSLQSSFKGFAGVERVASVQREVLDLQRELGEKAKTEFENQ